MYNLNKQEFVIDDDESDFTLKDGDDKTIFLTFKLDDPDDFEDSDDYAFFVWAQGEDEKNNDQFVCQAVSEEIEVIVDSDFLVLDNFEIEGIPLDEDNTYPDTLSCESTFQITADLWNIGDSEQEDISVRVYNKDLEILDEELEIGDVNEFDSEPISFSLTIPKGLDEKFYVLEFTVYEDNDVFENGYTDDDAEFKVLIEVEGNCVIPQAEVTASLESGGKAGRDLVVRATITNTGNSQTTYVLNAVGYSTWASEAFVEPSTLTLEAGQSTDVFLTFDVKSSASGENTFNLEVLSDNELVSSQPISVPIQKSFVGNLFAQGSAVPYLVVGILVILAILIVVFVVRFIRR